MSETLSIDQSALLAAAAKRARILWAFLFTGAGLLVLLGILFLGLQLRDVVAELREHRQYGDREGGRTLQETKESARAEMQERQVAPRKGAPADAPPSRLNTKELRQEDVAGFEKRTGLDVDRDGKVDGRAAADVDQEKLEHGGRQGKADVEAGPASDPWTAIGSFKAPHTGHKGATLDLTWNERTGETRPTWTLHQPRAIAFPNELELGGYWEFGNATDGIRKGVDNFGGSASWTPVLVKGVVFVTLGVAYERHGTLLERARELEDATGADLSELTRSLEGEAVYRLSARIRCDGFRTCRTW